MIEQEYGNYRDPITEFVHALYVDYNFDLAQEKLAACEVCPAQAGPVAPLAVRAAGVCVGGYPPQAEIRY